MLLANGNNGRVISEGPEIDEGIFNLGKSGGGTKCRPSYSSSKVVSCLVKVGQVLKTRGT